MEKGSVAQQLQQQAQQMLALYKPNEQVRTVSGLVLPAISENGLINLSSEVFVRGEEHGEAQWLPYVAGVETRGWVRKPFLTPDQDMMPGVAYLLEEEGFKSEQGDGQQAVEVQGEFWRFRERGDLRVLQDLPIGVFISFTPLVKVDIGGGREKWRFDFNLDVAKSQCNLKRDPPMSTLLNTAAQLWKRRGGPFGGR